MTQNEIIKALAELGGTTQRRAAGELRNLASFMHETLITCGEFPLYGLGKLKLVSRAARAARNPVTGESMQLPPRKAIKFVPSKAVKEALR